MSDQSTFDLWLDDQPKNLRCLLVAIRSAILEANPDFTEAKKWGTPNYWLPRSFATHDMHDQCVQRSVRAS